jgi:hypothetical protein
VFWDDLIRRWRRENPANSPRLLRAAGGHVAVLPSPRRRWRAPLWILIVILFVLLGLALGTPRLPQDAGHSEAAIGATV